MEQKREPRSKPTYLSTAKQFLKTVLRIEIGERIAFPTNGAGKIIYPHTEKMKLNPYL
jgi:hypothetical protein